MSISDPASRHFSSHLTPGLPGLRGSISIGLGSILLFLPSTLAQTLPELKPAEGDSSVEQPIASPRVDVATPFDTAEETTHRRITWDDFQGKPFKKKARGEDARIATAIRSDPFQVKVRLLNRGYWVAVPVQVSFYAAMDKRASSVAQSAQTDLLLIHEQGHFDLTEIIARRLTRSLGAFEAHGATEAEARSQVMSRIQQAHDQAAAELKELHARYDQETRHGQSARRQQDWNERIAQMLRETDSVTLPLMP